MIAFKDFETHSQIIKLGKYANKPGCALDVQGCHHPPLQNSLTFIDFPYPYTDPNVNYTLYINRLKVTLESFGELYLKNISLYGSK